MKNFLELYGQFYCHRFEIRMIAADDVVFDAWTGAVVRNNLLYAADKVCFLLAQLLLKENITCLVSTTERITTEKNGTKISEFRFGRFREYKLL